ncbi:MAG: polysaccharide deacetylase family protein [Janthinobacterium lividum]
MERCRPLVLLFVVAAWLSSAGDGWAQTPKPSSEAKPETPLSKTHMPQVAFTFDDLPAHGPLPPGMARPAVVASILNTLHREKMPPVYGFINGFRVEEFPYQIHILEAWHAAGEPLGNHTWSHPELDQLSAPQYEANIAQNEALLQRVDPQGDWHWFRYPFLEEGNTVSKRDAVRTWLSAHGYRTAEVSMDFQDYLWNEPFARCSAKHDAAAIQQLHDTYLATAKTYIGVYRELAHRLYGHDVPYVLLMHVGAFDAHMLPELIGLFREQGFAFTTLETAMADPVYRADPEVPTPGGSTFNEMVATVRHVDVPDAQEPDKMLDHLCR